MVSILAKFQGASIRKACYTRFENDDKDFSLPTLIGDPDFVWTLKQWDNTNWQRSSPVQIKPLQPETVLPQ
jgi:hypothetical protein